MLKRFCSQCWCEWWWMVQSIDSCPVTALVDTRWLREASIIKSQWNVSEIPETCKNKVLGSHKLNDISASGQQVWVANSVGRSPSPWASGRTGPAPPEGLGPPVFLRVSATTAVLDIHPPTQPNGIISLYRVFSLHHNNRTLVNTTVLTILLMFMEMFPLSNMFTQTFSITLHFL